MAEVVIDPELPESVRRELAQAPLAALVKFSAPASRAAQPKDADSGGSARPSRALAASLMVGGLANAVVILLFTIKFASGPAFDAVLLASVFFLCVFFVGFALYPVNQTVRAAASDQSDRLARARRAAVTYHRRYVAAELDLHGEARVLWDRASRAAKVIRRSEAVRLGLIDSVQVNAVLPYHLWTVAERLALLSGPQSRQRAILRDLDENDPDVRTLLGPQRRARELAVADVAPRVRALEVFAELAARADAARKRKRALEELAGLNPDYEELLVRLGGTENLLGEAGSVADELRALADSADDAVRKANEAGRNLIIPAST